MTAKKAILVAPFFIIGIILLAGGFFCGIFFEKNKLAPDIVKMENLQKVENAVSSKVVSSIIARGKVSKIAGKTVTLSSNAESIEILVKDSTVFLSYVGSVVGGKVPKIVAPTKQVGFSDIKIGSTLSATIKISPSGQTEAVSVAIFSAGS